METGQKVRDLIIETLQKKELSKKQILEEVCLRTNREISNKALNENLMATCNLLSTAGIRYLSSFCIVY